MVLWIGSGSVYLVYRSNLYDPIIGRYVLDNWEEVINVVKNGNECDK